MGLLNERAVLAHMVDVTDEELELVAASGAAVVHNPVSNLKLASGFTRVRDMVRAGVPVSLGTDGACSNNSLDMFETMKLAAILAKGYSGDATAVPAMQALKMATEEGARIFRTPGLGTLVPGAPADMIALNLDEPNLCPISTKRPMPFMPLPARIACSPWWKGEFCMIMEFTRTACMRIPPRKCGIW